MAELICTTLINLTGNSVGLLRNSYTIDSVLTSPSRL